MSVHYYYKSVTNKCTSDTEQFACTQNFDSPRKTQLLQGESYDVSKEILYIVYNNKELSQNLSSMLYKKSN